MRSLPVVLALPLALALTACDRAPTAPPAISSTPEVAFQRPIPAGTGIVLDNVTSLPIDLLGDVTANVNVVITGLQVSALGGLVATGTIQGTIDALGTQIVAQDFSTAVVLSGGGGPGNCQAVNVNLSPINVNVLNQTVAVDLPVTQVQVGAYGAVGNLLCTLTNLVNNLAPIGAITGVVNALTGLLSGGGPPALPGPPAAAAAPGRG